MDRLLAIGKSDPGLILLPTSDETAWLYTLNAEALGRYFRVVQPPIATLHNILDKKLFADASIRAGLAVVPTWSPRNVSEVAVLAAELPYPLVIKPRTHVHRLRNDKGIVVYSPDDLKIQYEKFIDREQSRTVGDQLVREASVPILQPFVGVGSEGVYSVTGFIDRTGELFVTRGATKVFQRTQPLGVGVCFESRSPPPTLSDAVRRMCRELGYFGMFEVEFLWFDGRWAAIDFNPRLFNQIGMDIRRAMPLPFLVCLEALGETKALRYAVGHAQKESEDLAVFCDRFTLRAILLAQTMTGRISKGDRVYWRAWMKRHASCTVDLVRDDNDPMPSFVHALSEIYLGIKSFPRFLRTTPRTSSRATHFATMGRL